MQKIPVCIKADFMNFLRKQIIGLVLSLYTSDAADDLTRVDLGGRRIIHKRKEPRKLFTRHIDVFAAAVVDHIVCLTLSQTN